MKFNQTVRNPPAGSQTTVPTGAPTVPNQASNPASNKTFVATLAQAEPNQQKQLIGEQLYRAIFNTYPEYAGKITGVCDTSFYPSDGVYRV